MRIIDNETNHIESMRHIIKEDELTILRLQNKTRILDIELEERKKLVEEYRSYLKDMSKYTVKSPQLKPLADSQIHARPSELKLLRVKA